MALGTTFGTIHSYTNLNLIQQKVEISPAEPKTKFIDIPGGDGSIDVTEALGTGVHYYDRTIKWTFALYASDDWMTKQKQVSNALNGQRMNIKIDGDTNYYYDGRITVANYRRDQTLRQITVTAVCKPYKFKVEATHVESALTTSYVNLGLPNGRMPVCPTIHMTYGGKVKFNDVEYDAPAGTYKLLNIVLSQGSNTLLAKVNSDTGDIEVDYRQGEL